MASRLDLQKKLEELLGNRNVYYKPPSNISMSYPAIKYSKNKITSKHANDKIYGSRIQYTLTIIDRKPDNPVIAKLLELPYCSYDRNYKLDNLEHDVLTLYY